MRLADQVDMVDNLWVIDEASGLVLWHAHNTVTETFRQSVANWLKGTAVTVPTHIALGTSVKLSTENDRWFTALKKEFARVAIGSSSLNSSDTVRYVAIFLSTEGVGEIKELGLFNAAATATQLSACDVTTNWSTGGGNTLTTDSTTEWREGTASLKVTGTAANLLTNTSLAVSVSSHTTDSYLQYWHYVDTVANLNGDFTVKLFVNTGAGAYDAAIYYSWTVAKADLANNWNRTQLQISDATANGGAAIATHNSVKGLSVVNAGVASSSVVQRVDDIRLFKDTGDLWARGQPRSTITKAQGQVVGVYWYISMKEGGATLAYASFAKESLTVSTTAVTLTSSVYAPTGADAAKAASIYVRNAPINYWKSGDTPTVTAGLQAFPGDIIRLETAGDISSFKAIRALNLYNGTTFPSGTARDATLEAQYER